MPEIVVTTKFFHYRQNNSGGHFDVDDETGIGPHVWIEALDLSDANSRAKRLGIYFDGCAIGLDCPCCGDRWSEPWDEDGHAEVEGYGSSDFGWHDTVYVHRIGGAIERISRSDRPIAAKAEGRS